MSWTDITASRRLLPWLVRHAGWVLSLLLILVGAARQPDVPTIDLFLIAGAAVAIANVLYVVAGGVVVLIRTAPSRPLAERHRLGQALARLFSALTAGFLLLVGAFAGFIFASLPQPRSEAEFNQAIRTIGSLVLEGATFCYAIWMFYFMIVTYRAISKSVPHIWPRWALERTPEAVAASIFLVLLLIPVVLLQPT